MSDPSNPVTLDLLGRMITELRIEVRELRDMQAALLGHLRRVERSQYEWKQDIRLMLQANNDALSRRT